MSKFLNLLFCATVTIAISTTPAFAKKKGPNGEETKQDCLNTFEICQDTGCKDLVGAELEKCGVDCNTEYTACADAVGRTAKPLSKRAQDAAKKTEGHELTPQQKSLETGTTEQKAKSQ